MQYLRHYRFLLFDHKKDLNPHKYKNINYIDSFCDANYAMQ